MGTGSKEPTTVSVDFGDGSPPAQREITGSATPSFDHAYQQAGEFHIVFTVTDSLGESVTGDGLVLVEDPVAAAGPDVTVDEGGSATLGGPSTEQDRYTSVTWNFGDGSPSEPGVQRSTATATKACTRPPSP